MTLAEKVHAECGGRGEVHCRSSQRNFVGGEERSTAQLQIRNHVASHGKIPLQIQWIQSRPIGRVAQLEYQIRRHSINRIFKPAFEESGAERLGQYPAIAQASVPDASVAATAGDGITARGPHLNFGCALLRAYLRERTRAEQHCEEDQKGS